MVNTKVQNSENPLFTQAWTEFEKMLACFSDRIADGHLKDASRNFSNNPEKIRQILQLDKRLGNFLFSTLASAFLLRHMYLYYKKATGKFLYLISREIEAHINYQSEIPSIAENLNHILEFIQAHSQSTNIFANWDNSCNLFFKENDKIIDLLNRKTMLSCKDFSDIKHPTIPRNLISLLRYLSECLADGIIDFSHTIGKNLPLFQHRQSWTQFSQFQEKILSFSSSLDDMSKKRSNIFACNTLQIRNQNLQALMPICDLMESIIRHIFLLEDLGVSTPRKQSDFSIENLQYVQSLSRLLSQKHLEPRDVDKSCINMINYANSNGISCADLLDEEVVNLFPGVSRDLLTRSRMHVRLDDLNNPASVAYKNRLLTNIRPYIERNQGNICPLKEAITDRHNSKS